MINSSTNALNTESNVLATTGNSSQVKSFYNFGAFSFPTTGVVVQYVYASNTADFNYNTTWKFTWAFSFQINNLTAQTNAQFLVCKRQTGATSGWSISYINPNNLTLIQITDTPNIFNMRTVDNSITSTTGWYRCMAVFSSITSDCKIIVNNTLCPVTTTASSGTITSVSNTNNLTFGSLQTSNGFNLQGGMDEICFWNYDASSLSAEDYNNGISFNRLNMSVKPEHYWRAEYNTNDSGTGTPITLTLTGSATYTGNVPL